MKAVRLSFGHIKISVCSLRFLLAAMLYTLILFISVAYDYRVSGEGVDAYYFLNYAYANSSTYLFLLIAGAMSGYENLKMLAQIRRRVPKERVKWAMERVGLVPSDRKPVGKYSLGMRQRLGLAQAIMENPDFLILDEPFNGLDKNGTAEMRNLMVELKNLGKTIIMASHSSEDIAAICDEVYEMEDGTIRKQEAIV